MRTVIALALALVLAGCGSRRELRPQEGQSLPPAPYGAQAAPTPGELLTPEPQARPTRSNEVLTRSEEREGDRFDLPPP